jgi:hypothetical protein
MGRDDLDLIRAARVAVNAALDRYNEHVVTYGIPYAEAGKVAAHLVASRAALTASLGIDGYYERENP